MDLILLISFVFGLVYLGMEQAKAHAERRMVAVRGRATVTSTKWGVILSDHGHR